MPCKNHKCMNEYITLLFKNRTPGILLICFMIAGSLISCTTVNKPYDGYWMLKETGSDQVFFMYFHFTQLSSDEYDVYMSGPNVRVFTMKNGLLRINIQEIKIDLKDNNVTVQFTKGPQITKPLIGERIYSMDKNDPFIGKFLFFNANGSEETDGIIYSIMKTPKRYLIIMGNFIHGAGYPAGNTLEFPYFTFSRAVCWLKNKDILMFRSYLDSESNRKAGILDLPEGTSVLREGIRLIESGQTDPYIGKWVNDDESASEKVLNLYKTSHDQYIVQFGFDIHGVKVNLHNGEFTAQMDARQYTISIKNNILYMKVLDYGKIKSYEFRKKHRKDDYILF